MKKITGLFVVLLSFISIGNTSATGDIVVDVSGTKIANEQPIIVVTGVIDDTLVIDKIYSGIIQNFESDYKNDLFEKSFIEKNMNWWMTVVSILGTLFGIITGYFLYLTSKYKDEGKEILEEIKKTGGSIDELKNLTSFIQEFSIANTWISQGECDRAFEGFKAILIKYNNLPGVNQGQQKLCCEQLLTCYFQAIQNDHYGIKNGRGNIENLKENIQKVEQVCNELKKYHNIDVSCLCGELHGEITAIKEEHKI